MVEVIALDDVFIKRAKELVVSAESGNDEEVKAILDELITMKETSLFQELGKLTRDVHETFKAFRTDSRITELAEGGGIADAKERLHYVVTMTQQAADTTMNQIENAIPLCESITSGTSELLSSWERFTQRQMQAEEFRQLSKTLKVFLETANNDSNTLMANLNEIMMAQSYQDLTGQIIYKVIKLVEDVEEDLINLIKLSCKHTGQNTGSDSSAFLSGTTEPSAGKQSSAGKQPSAGKEPLAGKQSLTANKNKQKSALDGPVVPGLVDEAETLAGQDEVDDLLSSLGF